MLQAQMDSMAPSWKNLEYGQFHRGNLNFDNINGFFITLIPKKDAASQSILTYFPSQQFFEIAD
jgi:hypothetical protein